MEVRRKGRSLTESWLRNRKMNRTRTRSGPQSTAVMRKGQNTNEQVHMTKKTTTMMMRLGVSSQHACLTPVSMLACSSDAV